MDPLFTPNMLRALALSRRLVAAPLPKLIGTRMVLRDGAGGFDDVVRVLGRWVGPWLDLDVPARRLALATLQKYDFADLRAFVGPETFARHGARRGLAALRINGLLDARPDRGDVDPELALEALGMYEERVTPTQAYAHVFARARRSWWSRVTSGDRSRGRLPATLVVERAVVSNCSMSPWAFGYL